MKGKFVEEEMEVKQKGEYTVHIQYVEVGNGGGEIGG